MTLRDHQARALRSLRNGAVLWGGVGSGKSRVAVEYYLEKEMPRDIYVITTAKKRSTYDWDREFARVAVGTKSDETVGGILTVDSWNNIGKYTHITDAFFILDEQRIVGTGSWVKSFLKIARANRWILLSATPGDTWLDYAPIFIAHGFYRNITEFKARHVIYRPYTKFPMIDRYIDTNHLDRLARYVLVQMDFDRHTTRHEEIVHVDHDRVMIKNVLKQRWNPFRQKPIKNVSELYAVMRRIVYTDPSRLITLRELIEKHHRVIVFYNFDYELEMLLQFLSTVDGVDVRQWNGHQHDELPHSSSWVYLVQYMAGSEGWECVETNVVVFYSLTYSYKQWEQAHGRIDRLNTPYLDLFYYVFMSSAQADRGPWKALRAKKNFTEGKDTRQLILKQ